MSEKEVIHFNRRLNSDANKPANHGVVSLVGAGPGDPDLLTVKALRCIQTADLILYDRLVSEEICQLFPAETPALYVGKSKNNHSIPQHELNQLLLTRARQGLNICRLKGGDSFIFGRGGEEMLILKEADIHVEVIPGITAASGASTYSGIPLTHRHVSQGCTFVTAHAEQDLKINWQGLASLDHTLVFYMGLSRADDISTNLIQSGLSPETPVAIVENGCCKNQRLVTGKLPQLSELAMANAIQSPALIIVGEVVNLSEQLQWFQTETLAQSFKNKISA